MKKTILCLAIFAAALTASAQMPVGGNQQLLRGIGPVENVNNNPQYGTDIREMPENAQTFINTLFPNVAVASVQKDLKDKEWDVKMANGYEITFDYNGTWLEVESPDNATLSSEQVNMLVPQNQVIATLSGDAVVPGGIVNFVEDIEYIPGFGYVVEYAAVGQPDGKVAVDTNGNVKTMKDLKSYKAQAKGKKGNRDAGKKTNRKKGNKKGGRAYNPQAQNWTQQNCN